MIINSTVQHDMYRYLISDKSINVKIDNRSINDFIFYEIKLLAKKLFKRTELFICKASVERGENDRIVKKKNYKCISNKFIYDILKEIGTVKFISEEISKELDFCEDIDDFTNIAETGSKDRKKLIRLCKLYMDNKEIIKDIQSDIEYEIANEAWLAEKVLYKYSADKTGLAYIVDRKNNLMQRRLLHAYAMKADIVLKRDNIIIVVDVKVYQKIGKKDKEHHLYSYNDNRFQLNSYMGKCIERYGEQSIVYGIILHIVNTEIFDAEAVLQNAELTVEGKRPIEMFMINADKGLEYIFSEYKHKIERIVNLLEQNNSMINS